MEVINFPRKPEVDHSPVAFMEWATAAVKERAELFGERVQIASVLMLDEKGRLHVLFGGEGHTSVGEIGLYHLGIDSVLDRVNGA